MSSLLITGGRIIDPASSRDEVADIAVADGIVAAVGRDLERGPADRVIEAGDRIVTPGLIDPHVHLREPGGEEAETIESGSRAAVAGGFTSVCCMPNTTPTLDDASMIEFVYKQASQHAACRVFPVGAATVGRKGEWLAEMALMADAGAVAFSDDGDAVASPGMMRKVLQYVRSLNIHAGGEAGVRGAGSGESGGVFAQHCQEPSLTPGSSMHAGDVSARLGLTGWPRVAEELIVERDVRLNADIHCRYHVQHMSSGGSVEIVRRAQRQGQPVTAEASPHHLTLTHEAVESGNGVTRAGPYWTLAKMNPPLREQSDINTLLEAIADGTVSVLATDHAPHTAERKGLAFESAPFGIVGLETALGLYIRALIEPGVIDWPRLVELLTVEPARLCNLDRRGLARLAVGDHADITIIDPDHVWTVSEADLAGKSTNTPFLGWRLKGRAVATIVGGKLVYELPGAGSSSAQRV